ncbi:MAG: hypothetical protein Tp178MES00d2C33159851_158 [Prokaryotic dsDNA virus sp.]|nr:MAG: hypothetical protein Tp178MES00d2C33159851_158 [Prokaryotic dsDNA virus sp.]
MTIETFNAIKSEADAMFSSAFELETRINNAETAGVIIPLEVDTAFTAITTNLQTIINWVNQAIADGGVTEPVLTTVQQFLSEIKTVFEKYSAVLSIIDGTGYGDSYGGADVIQFTVTDPSTGQVTTKEFIKTSLTAVDMI